MLSNRDVINFLSVLRSYQYVRQNLDHVARMCLLPRHRVLSLNSIKSLPRPHTSQTFLKSRLKMKSFVALFLLAAVAFVNGE